ncbi:MAG: hypothetical protein AAF386_02085, partial [Pseudomonadota bacterium]
MKIVIWATSGLVLMGMLGGLMGGVHPIGDSLAVGRIPLAICCVVLGLGAKRHRACLIMACIGIAILTSTWIDRQRDTGPSGPMVVYQKNLLFLNNA